LRSLEFDVTAFEDLAWWVEKDRTQALRIIREIQREPFGGIGKPEPLRQAHRLVYQVNDDKIRILACRYHY
jgi:toxin YoeB